MLSFHRHSIRFTRPTMSPTLGHVSRSILATTTTRAVRVSSRLVHSSSRLSESDRTHPALVRDPPVANPSAASDPWPLRPPPMPESPPLPRGVETMQDLLATPHPEGRDDEPTETLRKRLVYESRKRGILEMDLILSTFANERLQHLDDRQLREYDRVRPLSLERFSPFDRPPDETPFSLSLSS